MVDNVVAIRPGIPDTHCICNVTWSGQNGDLPDPIAYDLPDADVIRNLNEVLRAGGIPGITADPNANLTGFVVDRFEAKDDMPYRRMAVRPKTAFGGPDVATATQPEHILQFFAYAHLPAHLQAVSKPFCELAHAMVLGDNEPDNLVGRVTFGGPLPRNPERTVALRKLLEAKDAAVRALVAA